MPHHLQEGDILVKEHIDGVYPVLKRQEGRWIVLGQWSLYNLREACDRDNLVLIEARPAGATYTGVYRQEQKM